MVRHWVPFVALIALVSSCTASPRVSEPPAAAAAPTGTVAPSPTPTPEPCGPPASPAADAATFEPPVDAGTEVGVESLGTNPPNVGRADLLTESVTLPGATEADMRYVLGPAWPLELISARPDELGPGDCTVLMAFTPQGLSIFNEIGGECFDNAPRCPWGQLAIVADGLVQSAPVVNAPEFTENEIVVARSDGLSANEATALAIALVTDAQLRPVLLPPATGF